MIKAKKWLGQHFLGDASICKRIAALLPQQGEGQNLVEIGPGAGALTRFLPTDGYRALYLLDVDLESINLLRTNYPTEPYHVWLADFLVQDFSAFGPEPVVLVGNLPYNISSQIFFKVLEHIDQIPHFTCMVQKEVARRIASKPGNKEYGILSVLLQTWYRVEYNFTVKPGSFIPPPKVDSGVISFKRNTRTDLGMDRQRFVSLVKAGFNQRRKTLRNALSGALRLGQESSPALEVFLSQRAEQLSVENWLALASLLA